MKSSIGHMQFLCILPLYKNTRYYHNINPIRPVFAGRSLSSLVRRSRFSLAPQRGLISVIDKQQCRQITDYSAKDSRINSRKLRKHDGSNMDGAAITAAALKSQVSFLLKFARKCENKIRLGFRSSKNS